MKPKKVLFLLSLILMLLMAKHYFRSSQVTELQLSNWFQPRKLTAELRQDPDLRLMSTVPPEGAVWRSVASGQVLELAGSQVRSATHHGPTVLVCSLAEHADLSQEIFFLDSLGLSVWTSKKRPDVLTLTPWLAPVLWEGTFSRQALERHYRGQNLTVGLAVFASGSSAEANLEQFLRSATMYFMPGQQVIFYVILDSYTMPLDVPLGPLQSLQVLMIAGEDKWWPDLDLLFLQTLKEHLVDHIKGEVDFLFAMTSNLVFQGEFGLETLGTSVAQLHPWWYFQKPQHLPYVRNPSSEAYIPFGQGDFYYGSTIVGGMPWQVLDLVEECLRGMIQDQNKRLNSSYEKCLNKYFFLHKPAKLLSPEYGWDLTLNLPPQVRYVKVAQQRRAT